ncbi:MAG: TlpA disulfide reductase family protein [Chloroflexota bacterium]
MWLTWTPAIVVIAGLLFLFGYSLSTQARNAGLGVQRVAGPAHDFALPKLGGGGTVQLSSFKGHPVLVNFWASWCIPCRQEAPTLEQTWQTYKGRGVMFVGVDVWDKQADAQAFVKQFGITYPIAVDADGKVAIDYGVRGVPETFFIDRAGRLRSKYVGPVLNRGSGELQLGAIDPNFLGKELEGLLR